MVGALLLAAVFLASGASLIKAGREGPRDDDGQAEPPGPRRRKLWFGVFLVVLGVLFAGYGLAIGWHPVRG